MSIRASFLSILLLPSILSAAPVVTFEAGAVQAAGVTPASKVVFFGVAREGQGYRFRVVTREEVVEDTDQDGAVRLDLGGPVAFRSIWAAVDLASGEYAVASPEGYTPTRIELPAAALRSRAGGNGKPDRLIERRYSLELLVVRPGQGAWRQTLGDGDPGDGDHAANGQLEWSMGKGRAVRGGPPAPADLDLGDVIVAIDPTRMEYYATRLSGGRP